MADLAALEKQLDSKQPPDALPRGQLAGWSPALKPAEGSAPSAMALEAPPAAAAEPAAADQKKKKKKEKKQRQPPPAPRALVELHLPRLLSLDGARGQRLHHIS